MVGTKARLGIFCDAEGENWPSMDLAAEMLVHGLQATPRAAFEVTAFRPRVPFLWRRLKESPFTWNLDRALARYFRYPRLVRARRQDFDVFHIVDHSYAHLARSLPGAQTGIYCHDLDAFRALINLESTAKAALHRRLAHHLLSGLRRAGVVFVNTESLRSELIRLQWQPADRVVCAPLGVAPEFTPARDVQVLPLALGGLRGRRYILHVGSAIGRKRLDVLFEVFARLRTRFPDVYLVQQGAALSEPLREQIRRLGIAPRLVQLPTLTRSELAELYRSASLVLLPSEREGFGLPVIESLACGTAVLASDLDTLREAGGRAVRYCPVGDIEAWSEAAIQALDQPDTLPPKASRIAQASNFTWARHAGIIEGTYLQLLEKA